MQAMRTPFKKKYQTTPKRLLIKYQTLEFNKEPKNTITHKLFFYGENFSQHHNLHTLPKYVSLITLVSSESV